MENSYKWPIISLSCVIIAEQLVSLSLFQGTVISPLELCLVASSVCCTRYLGYRSRG